jgi:hypothetical protein
VSTLLCLLPFLAYHTNRVRSTVLTVSYLIKHFIPFPVVVCFIAHVRAFRSFIMPRAERSALALASAIYFSMSRFVVLNLLDFTYSMVGNTTRVALQYAVCMLRRRIFMHIGQF